SVRFSFWFSSAFRGKRPALLNTSSSPFSSVISPQIEAPTMDPYGPPLTEPLTDQERQLKNEVIFLHYLWHQGPPSPLPLPPFTHPHSNPNPYHNPNPSHYPSPYSNHNPQFPHPHSLSRNLGPSNVPSFKRTKNHKSKGKKKRNSNSQQTDPGPDWPVDSPRQSPSTSGWPPFNPNQDRKVSEPDPGTLAKIATMQLQKQAAKRFSEFLDEKTDDSDSSDEEEEEEDVEEGFFDGSVSDVQASEEYKFLLSVFVDDRELRELYERSQENGELICLACEAMGAKLGKTYKEAMGLVRHALTITKTGRKRDHNSSDKAIWKRCHRALGLVICRVYGWDVSRYPIITAKDEPLGLSLKNSGHAQCEPQSNADCTENRIQDLDSKVESVSGNNGELTCGESSNDHQNKIIQASSKTCEVKDEVIKNPVPLGEEHTGGECNNLDATHSGGLTKGSGEDDMKNVVTEGR
ncbi:hypothetical protein LINPERHAP2_LOCUS31235, partial [Linum perenne]